MKLLLLPYVIQKEVFDHFNGNEILLFSMSSKNVQNLILFNQKSRFAGIEYSLSQSSTNVQSIHRSRHDSTLLSIVPRFGADCATERNISGMPVQLLMANSRHQLVALHNDPVPMLFEDSHVHAEASHMSKITEAVHEYINSFLGNRTEYYLDVNSIYDFSTSPAIHSLPALKNIKGATIQGKTIKAELLEKVFSVPADNYHIVLDAWIVGELSERSALFNAESLTISAQRNDKVSKILAHFNGKRLHIKIDEDASLRVIEFLNGWKSNEDVGRYLECLTARPFTNQNVPRTFSHVDQIQDLVGIKKLEDTHPELIINRTEKTRNYIVRERDGRVAAVLVTRSAIHFQQTDWTEKELLGDTQ